LGVGTPSGDTGGFIFDEENASLYMKYNDSNGSAMTSSDWNKIGEPLGVFKQKALAYKKYLLSKPDPKRDSLISDLNRLLSHPRPR